MAKAEAKAIEKMTYEEAFQELEGIVTALEAGDQTLDGTLALFERGHALTKHCSVLLEKADLKVRKLSGPGMDEFEAGA